MAKYLASDGEAIFPVERQHLMLYSPLGQLVPNRAHLVSHLLDAEDLFRSVSSDEPIPEGRAEVETIMEVLGGDENVRVEEVGHQYSTPRLRPNSLKVFIFFKPSIRNVSVNAVRPSSVLTTSARAKRLLTRAPSVR